MPRYGSLAEAEKDVAGRDEDLTKRYAAAGGMEAGFPDASEDDLRQIVLLETEQMEAVREEAELRQRFELKREREKREMRNAVAKSGNPHARKRGLSIREALEEAGGFKMVAEGKATLDNIDPIELIRDPGYMAAYATLAGEADAPRLPFILPAVTGIVQAPPNVLDAIPIQTVTTDVVRFRRRQTGADSINRVASRASAGNVEDTTPRYEDADTNIRNYAGYSDVAREDLGDVDYVEGQVLTDLREDITTALNAAIVAGDGAGTNIRGILNTQGPATATAVAASGAGGNALVGLGTALGVVRAENQMPATHFLLHPKNYATMRVKVDNGIWAAGPPTAAYGVGFFGRTVIEDTNVTENTGIATTFGLGATFLAMREVAAILRSDDVEIKSLRVTFVGQVRAALVVRRPKGTALITNLNEA